MTTQDEDLGALVRKGVRWSFASTLVSRLANLISGMILARLLTPNDYGLFAVATVVLVILININDLGIEQVLVRWPGDVSKVAPTATTVIFGFSCVMFLVFFGGAGLFATALGAPEATELVQVLSVSLLINGALAVPSAILTRSFRQDLRLYADMSGFVITTGLTLALALAGVGVWSLVWGRLAGNLVNGLMHLALTPARYKPAFDPKIAKELLRNGIPLGGATLLTVLMVNLDNMVIGPILGPTTLGLYVLAFNLSSWPITLLSIPVARVSVPAFARLQHDLDAVRVAFTRSMGLLMAAAVPICGLLAIMAVPTIRLMYGEKWVGAATALVFLAVLGVARVALQLCFDLLIALGHARRTLALQAMWVVALLPALVLGASVGGVAGVGVAHMLVAVLIMVPAFLWTLGRLGIPAAGLAKAVARPFAGVLLLCVVPFLATRHLSPDLLILAVGGIGGLLLYLPVVAPMRSGLAELTSVGKKEAAGQHP
ncbi:polysaccharide transporter, PST family [Actinokineospora alba]|uniref:Polysaccharide transporter, PST family n=1 Tax=Actinokineospora alba TaxID=504798 RepID=A0A1H0PHB1_9PSEU|nr:lipopolysaccharide biosynthesis protein [Actinokineospora alba]TDP65785.1 PST family polysaccharide transporter [Actinokineospora alba]SDI65188.1 polysaccharide transporter, PST family [Actinokineospora alba]SDP04035.1 polysaccharide transporter, PST family [Actinokineospora alba]